MCSQSIYLLFISFIEIKLVKLLRSFEVLCIFLVTVSWCLNRLKCTMFPTALLASKLIIVMLVSGLIFFRSPCILLITCFMD